MNLKDATDPAAVPNTDATFTGTGEASQQVDTSGETESSQEVTAGETGGRDDPQGNADPEPAVEGNDAEAEVLSGLNVKGPAKVEVTLLEAPANPLPLFINGVGNFKFQIGKPEVVAAEVLGALNDAKGVTFEQKDV